MNKKLIVLHETLYPYSQVKGAIQSSDSSYHYVILIDGTLVSIADPSSYVQAVGNIFYRDIEDVDLVGIHVSLESPYTSHPEDETHKGYEDLQYRTLARLINRLGFKASQVITHNEVDESYMDPRSLDARYLISLL